MSGTNLPVCAGQISPLVDELFISGTLMFEGLPWPKKIYSLILNLCHSDLSGYSSMLLHVCVRARLYMQADRPAVPPSTPPATLQQQHPPPAGHRWLVSTANKAKPKNKREAAAK